MNKKWRKKLRYPGDFMKAKVAIWSIAYSFLANLCMAGCLETVSSDNVKTQGIVAQIDVTATGSNKSKVVVKLLTVAGPNTQRVDLSANDRIYVAVNDDDPKKMRETGAGEFELSVEEGAEDTQYTVELQRADFDSAKSSTGELPAPIDITSDFGDEPYSRAKDDLIVEWEPAETGDAMTVSVQEKGDGGCFFDIEEQDLDGDPGSYQIGAGKLKSTRVSKSETCDGKVTVTRTRKGKPDKIFDAESRFRLHQVRTVNFVSAP